MKYFAPIIISLFFTLTANSQNVIGFSSSEVDIHFKANYPHLLLEANFKNDHYKYLKYTDSRSNLVTVLVFMNDIGKCKAVRFIYDLSLEKQVKDELNRKFKMIDDHTWHDTNGKMKSLIEYIEEDWFITVNYSEE